MKVLGIDPGTAALGYGIVERTGGRLREVDHGCLTTSPDLSLPERLLAIHALVDELLELHEPDLMGVERLFFSRNVQTALGVGQARGVVLLAAAQHGTPVREATPSEVKSAIAGYGAADKEQVQRMVQLVLGMSELPRPDDAADALAIATWVANTDRGAGRPRPAVLDRAAVAPITRGETGYERAVREALAAERAERRPTSAAPRSAASVGDRVGRGGRRRRRRRFAGHRGRRDRLSGLRRAGGPGLGTARQGRSSSTPTTSSARTSRRCTASGSTEELGFFTLLLTVNGVGPKVALAIVGSRPTPDLQLAIMAQDQAVLVVDPGDRQEARRADHLRAQGEGDRGRRLGRPARRSRAARRARARSSPRSRRSATRWPRRARRRARRSRMSASSPRSRNGSRRRCGACLRE